MSEMKLKMKGPLSIVIGVIVIGIVVYIQFFTSYFITDKDKKLIGEEIKKLRMSEMVQISNATLKEFKKSGNYLDKSEEIVDLSKDIEIIKIEAKRVLTGGGKIKVIYTVDGKTPKNDGGVRYFSIRKENRKKKLNRIKRVYLREITVDNFNSKNIF